MKHFINAKNLAATIFSLCVYKKEKIGFWCQTQYSMLWYANYKDTRWNRHQEMGSCAPSKTKESKLNHEVFVRIKNGGSGGLINHSLKVEVPEKENCPTFLSYFLAEGQGFFLIISPPKAPIKMS